MPQINNLLGTLKKALKSHGLTYARVAIHLDLTEASVKRLFSEQQISLQRLEQICQLMQMEISDLVQLMNEQQPQLQQLTREQEEEITRDLMLLLVTVCVLNRWTMEEILDWYKISEHDCLQKLIQLDKLKLIELLPRNKIKLRVATNFGWREGGPIQQFFQEKIAQEFFKARFDNQDEYLLVLNGMLSPASHKEFQRKLKRVAREFDELNNQDAGLPLEERKGVTLVLAARHWNYGLFKPLLNK
ncbi:helix-turn-helix domain-containing protein [Cellvibrio mixtus]|uniref:helix-turn-helix domain-containing protein n=1 Tax=Cellvibrio mixtus TaxID=39650 RepID=UPI0005878871|nr:helix-turn-helix transcriptional regulator [Cellvibrio mixtus]